MYHSLDHILECCFILGLVWFQGKIKDYAVRKSEKLEPPYWALSQLEQPKFIRYERIQQQGTFIGRLQGWFSHFFSFSIHIIHSDSLNQGEVNLDLAYYMAPILPSYYTVYSLAKVSSTSTPRHHNL